jgi:purine-binding chemotaxis protein CheW
LPHAPGYLRGVINLRGTVLPIMDLSERLGLGRREASGRDVIIVIEAEGRTIGLLVSAVSDILTVPTDALDAPPDLTGEDGARFLSSIALHGDCLTRVLDLSAVLPPVKSALI